MYGEDDRRRCICGKVCFTSVTDAREKTRHIGNRVRAYRCEEDHTVWHITQAEYKAAPIIHKKMLHGTKKPR